MDIRDGITPATWFNISIRPLVYPDYPPFDPDNPDTNIPNAIHVEIQCDAMRLGEVTVPALRGQGHGKTLGQAFVELGLQMAYPDFVDRIEALLAKAHNAQYRHDARKDEPK